MVKELGRAIQLMSAMPIVIRAVEMISWFFKAGSISLTVLTSKKSVAKRVVSKQTRMPIELMRSGYIIAVNSWLFPNEEMEATTRAAQEDSAYEPKRSDPIPAISPTLSPTLSAMTCNTFTLQPLKKTTKRTKNRQKKKTKGRSPFMTLNIFSVRSLSIHES